MSHTPLNAQFARAICERFTQRLTYILKALVSILQIQNKKHRLEQDLYTSYLTRPVHSGQERPKRSSRAVKRLARGVALVIGITLFLPVEQVSNAQLMPFKTAKQYAKTQMDSKQFSCLKKLWGKESAWNHLADNPHSTAYGIPQILGMKEKNPLKQVDLGIRYIRHRYDTPCKAWAFHKKHKWY